MSRLFATPNALSSRALSYPFPSISLLSHSSFFFHSPHWLLPSPSHARTLQRHTHTQNILYIHIYHYILPSFSHSHHGSLFDSSSMECYTILGSERKTEPTGKRQGRIGEDDEGEREKKDGKREYGGRKRGKGIDEGKARGGDSDEQNKVGRRERWEYWRREREIAYMYLRYSRRTQLIYIQHWSLKEVSITGSVPDGETMRRALWP